MLSIRLQPQAKTTVALSLWFIFLNSCDSAVLYYLMKTVGAKENNTPLVDYFITTWSTQFLLLKLIAPVIILGLFIYFYKENVNISLSIITNVFIIIILFNFWVLIANMFS